MKIGREEIHRRYRMEKKKIERERGETKVIVRNKNVLKLFG
jgi:hypothetical protein